MRGIITGRKWWTANSIFAKATFCSFAKILSLQFQPLYVFVKNCFLIWSSASVEYYSEDLTGHWTEQIAVNWWYLFKYAHADVCHSSIATNSYMTWSLKGKAEKAVLVWLHRGKVKSQSCVHATFYIYNVIIQALPNTTIVAMHVTVVPSKVSTC